MNILLLALIPACFALNPVIGRAMADSFQPATLSLVRWVLSALVIALVAALLRGERWRAPPGHLLRVAVLGALGMGFCAYAAFIASHTTAATNVSLIYSCASALVAAWEIAAGRQRLTGALLLGIAICLGGAVVILTRGHPEVLRTMTFTPGDLWAAAGMSVFVLYTVLMRRTPSLLTPMPQFSVMAAGASIVLLPVVAVEVMRVGVPAVDASTWPWIAALVLGSGIGAFLGYNTSLKRNGPVLTSASLTLTPVFAAGMATVLIGEQLAWYHAVAVAMVVTGLGLINRDQTGA